MRLAALLLALAAPAAAQHAAPLSEPGQGAFAAVAEAVARLEADPATDWSRADIPALVAHLRDMDRVILHAGVETRNLPDGAVFTVGGEGEIGAAARRMSLAHAATVDGAEGWSVEATPTATGAVLRVTVPPADLPKLRALGFAGFLARGAHHPMHHWAIASGRDPHAH